MEWTGLEEAEGDGGRGGETDGNAFFIQPIAIESGALGPECLGLRGLGIDARDGARQRFGAPLWKRGAYALPELCRAARRHPDCASQKYEGSEANLFKALCKKYMNGLAERDVDLEEGTGGGKGNGSCSSEEEKVMGGWRAALAPTDYYRHVGSDDLRGIAQFAWPEPPLGAQGSVGPPRRLGVRQGDQVRQTERGPRLRARSPDHDFS